MLLHVQIHPRLSQCHPTFSTHHGNFVRLPPLLPDLFHLALTTAFGPVEDTGRLTYYKIRGRIAHMCMQSGAGMVEDTAFQEQ